MRINIIAILMLFLPVLVKSQDIRPPFSTEGERQDYQIRKIFKDDYRPHDYAKFKGQMLDAQIFKFNNTIIKIYGSAELKAIFNEGLIYPAIFPVAHITPEIIPDSPPAVRPIFSIQYPSDEEDTLAVSAFGEIKFPGLSPKTKRFTFWLLRYHFANPTLYIIELTNKDANAETRLLDFIKGSKLTFFRYGWVII